MTRFQHLTISLAAALLGLAAAAMPASAGCRTIGGLAEMPTQAVAEFMADAALKNAIAAHNMRAAGPITMKCKESGVLMTTCVARRQACT